MDAAAKLTAMEGIRHLVLCDISGETYGIDIELVDTVIRNQPVTSVPCMPHFVEGVVNLRGSIIPVVDLRKRFNLVIKPTQRDSRIVVVRVKQQWVGLVVDAVTRTCHLPIDQIEAASSLVVNVKHRYIEGVAQLDEQIIIVLNIEQSLSSEEAADIDEASEFLQKEGFEQ